LEYLIECMYREYQYLRAKVSKHTFSWRAAGQLPNSRSWHANNGVCVQHTDSQRRLSGTRFLGLNSSVTAGNFLGLILERPDSYTPTRSAVIRRRTPTRVAWAGLVGPFSLFFLSFAFIFLFYISFSYHFIWFFGFSCTAFFTILNMVPSQKSLDFELLFKFWKMFKFNILFRFLVCSNLKFVPTWKFSTLEFVTIWILV
jgi:hypothetical protein